MQTMAVIRAAISVQRRHKGWNVKPEIMIPLTGDPKEFKFVKDIVVHVANEEIQAAEMKLNYEVGTMIEIPRAALTAGKSTRPKIHCGIGGEHGGDPTSVEFCHKIGLNYVSCSPFRVPRSLRARSRTRPSSSASERTTLRR